MRLPPWHVITGEYPPGGGGVADYSHSVAKALAAAGDEVHVWTPANRSGLVEGVDGIGVRVHSLEHGFDLRGMRSLAREFERWPRPRRVLLQYVPQAFGMRGMNLPFCAWIASLRDTQVWVMFHEVMVGAEPPRTLRRSVLAAATRGMASLLVARADRIFMSISAWEPLLRSVALRPPRVTWLPIPSSLPTQVASEARQDVRKRLDIEPNVPLIGHFGTYGGLVAPLLRRCVQGLLATDLRRRLLLLGRGGDTFARELAGPGSAPRLAPRIIAPGELDSHEAAAHLSACDVLVQPYIDGISTRRTSAMAGLALGVPIATNVGFLTESVWWDSGAVELAPRANGVDQAAEALLRDPARAGSVGARGRELYRSRFSLEHTIRALREPSDRRPESVR